jgi:geranylgeranyl diphosphate synthase type II
MEGGGRLRPRLLFAVVEACGGKIDDRVRAVAAAVELIHCASLVHDDLPAFDNAPLRRGKPSIQQRYGEAAAVLAGDGLILGAFAILAGLQGVEERVVSDLVRILSHAAGMPAGATAGQGWELEAASTLDIEAYHQAKTGAMFEAATMCGAVLIGRDPEPFRRFGALYGRAYQLIDDIRDATGTALVDGKLAGRDATLGRPNAVHREGLAESRAALQQTIEQAKTALPDCPRRAVLIAAADALLAKIEE